MVAAVGEVVGAIAVVLSIAYLAVQVRQNTSTATAGNQNAWLNDYNSLLMEIYHDPDESVLIRRAIHDFAGLTKAEQIRAHAFFSALVNNSQNTYFLSEQGTFDARSTAVVINFTAAVLKAPGGAFWWAAIKEVWNSEFTSAIDQLIASDAIQPVNAALPWFSADDD